MCYLQCCYNFICYIRQYLWVNISYVYSRQTVHIYFIAYSMRFSLHRCIALDCNKLDQHTNQTTIDIITRNAHAHVMPNGDGLVAPFVVVVRHPLLSLETSLSHNSLASIMTSFCREVLGCCREDARTP